MYHLLSMFVYGKVSMREDVPVHTLGERGSLRKKIQRFIWMTCKKVC